MKVGIVFLIMIFLMLIINGCNKDYVTQNEFEKVESKLNKLYTEEDYLNKINEIIESTVVIITNKGSGTGFIIDEEGYLVTAAHNVANLREEDIRIYFVDNINQIREKDPYFVEKIIRVNDTYDLAILKLNTTKKFKSLKITKKEDIGYGSEILFIGFQPLDDNGPIYLKLIGEGVISGYNTIQKGEDLILMYSVKGVALPGGSGGPVFLKSGGGIIGFITNTSPTTESVKEQIPEVERQLWIFHVVPIHSLNEKWEDFKKERIWS